MFETFTDRARKAVVEARNEAAELGHTVIGTEHLLLGMLRAGNGVAGVVLAEFGVTAEAVRDKVAPAGSRSEPVDPASALAAIGIDLGAVTEAIEASFGKGALRGQPSLRFTPEARDALRHSLEAALQLRHRFVGTEHLLLGVLRDREGLACETLAGLGVDLDGLADHVRRRVAPEQARLDESFKRFNDLAEQARASGGGGPSEARAAAIEALRAKVRRGEVISDIDRLAAVARADGPRAAAVRELRTQAMAEGMREETRAVAEAATRFADRLDAASEQLEAMLRETETGGPGDATSRSDEG